MLLSSRPGLHALLTSVLIVLAACGGSEDDDGGPTDPPPPPPPPPLDIALRVAGGGNNVPDRFTSDLWVSGDHAYTGTWGGVTRDGSSGNVVKIWRLDAAGVPTLADSIVLSGTPPTTVSDIEVSDDGSVLMFSREGAGAGLYTFSLVDPEHPAPLDFIPVRTGLHTATFGYIDGRRYAFAARNPPGAALDIYDVTDPAAVTAAASVPVEENYGIHDTFVRDGIAFVFAWNTGVIVLDVGNGIRGGTPQAPVEVSRIETAGGSAHNGWWFHNPVTDERRYLFVGQEGPGGVGVSSSGDIHVVDVSDLANPQEVASFHLDGAGTHNFWMDEDRQILYAAYYNAGVIALDVSGILSGSLTARQLSSIELGGSGTTFTWGVQLANGSLYASDMLSGFWQLAVDEVE